MSQIASLALKILGTLLAKRTTFRPPVCRRCETAFQVRLSYSLAKSILQNSTPILNQCSSTVTFPLKVLNKKAKYPIAMMMPMVHQMIPTLRP